MAIKDKRSRSGGAYWGIVGFLAMFGLLIVGVSTYFLIPALDAASNAAPADRQRLVAVSWLVMFVLLFVLLAVLLLTFRMGRLFFPRKREERTRTQYVDAWKESANRMPTPPAEEE